MISAGIRGNLWLDDRYITCVFGEPDGDKIIQKGVYAIKKIVASNPTVRKRRDKEVL